MMKRSRHSGVTFDSAVRFIPTTNGPFEATLFVASNDPSDGVQKIVLKGVGFGGPETAPPTIEQDSGCACRIATDVGTRSSTDAICLLGIGIALSMYRRVTWVKSDSNGSKTTHRRMRTREPAASISAGRTRPHVGWSTKTPPNRFLLAMVLRVTVSRAGHSRPRSTFSATPRLQSPCTVRAWPTPSSAAQVQGLSRYSVRCTK